MQSFWLRSSSWIGTLFSVLSLSGCASNWDAPTYFVFENLDPALAPKIKNAVGGYGFRPIAPGEVDELRVEDDDFAFQLTGLRAAGDIASAHAALEAALRPTHSPARLRYAELRYANVSAPASSAGASLAAQGRATPGSMVRLDVGTPELIAMPVLEDGIWSVSIPSSPALLERGGWIYGEAQKGGAKQYFRLNLLTGKQEGLLPRDLPATSALLRP